MGIFKFFRRSDINQGVQEFQNQESAVLLDVRTPQEYQDGHIPGSHNVPLQQLNNVEEIAEKKDTLLYVYCHSGVRSRQAVGTLKQMGYTNVHNIGGITAYRGELKKTKK